MRLIDADALVDHLIEILHVKPYGMLSVIEAAQTIDPVKHGKWLPHPSEPDWDVCSVCGTGTHRRFHECGNGRFWDVEESFQYCPWCGAKMDGGKE